MEGVRGVKLAKQTCTASKPSEFASFYEAAKDCFSKGMTLLLSMQSVDDERKAAQNALQFHWFREMEQQGDLSAREYRAYCKLHFGVPIAREDEGYRAQYDAVIKPLPYVQKIQMMDEQSKFYIPVTSTFNMTEMTRYLKEVERWGSGQGFNLTSNETLYLAAMGIKK